MDVVYSFWSKPYLKNGRAVHGTVHDRFALLCWIVSVGNSRRNRAQGTRDGGRGTGEGRVVLCTDTAGWEMLKPLGLGFDEVHLTLDSIPEGIMPEMWAYGKIIASQKTVGSKEYGVGSRKFVQLDYDAWFWKAGFDFAEVAVQHEELYNVHEFYPAVISKLKQWGYQSELLDVPVPYAYNCGIVGFADRTLTELYCQEAMRLAEWMSERPELYYSLGEYERKYFPCVFEQWILAALCFLLDVKVTQAWEGQDNRKALEYGYVHIWGCKGDYEIQRKLERMAEREFPEEYRNLNRMMVGRINN